jgi:hypothetical protein
MNPEPNRNGNEQPAGNNANRSPTKETDFGDVFARACVTALAFAVVGSIFGPVAGAFAATLFGGGDGGN